MVMTTMMNSSDLIALFRIPHPHFPLFWSVCEATRFPPFVVQAFAFAIPSLPGSLSRTGTAISALDQQTRLFHPPALSTLLLFSFLALGSALPIRLNILLFVLPPS